MNTVSKDNAGYGKYFIWLIILAGCLIRLINIQMPLLEGATTRQLHIAMVARNFYLHGLNFLYPFIEIRGSVPYVQSIDAPIISYLAAVLYRVFTGAHTEILRIISVVSTALATLFLYRLADFLSDRKTALIACFIFIFSPMSIFIGKSALIEMPLIFFTICVIYYFLRWRQEERIVFLVLAGLCFMMAALIKKTNLYLLLPLGYMAFSKWKWGSFRKNWILGIPVMIVLAWQAWEWHLRAVYPDPQWLHFNLQYNLEMMKFTYALQDFYKKVYLDILNYTLTPLGLVFFLVGIFLRPENRLWRVLYFWLAAVGFFYLIMPEQFWAHGYYHIHYLPIAAFFAARGFLFLIDKSRDRLLFGGRKAIVIIFGLMYLLFSAGYARMFYRIQEDKRFVLSTAEIVKEKIPSDRFIVAYLNNPISILYYSSRRGWPCQFSQKGVAEDISYLEGLRSKGADYLVCADRPSFEQNSDFLNYLTRHYKVSFQNEFCLIVDLQ